MKNKKCRSKKIKLQKVIEQGRQKNVLIVENVQNCFFTGGSMGFIEKLEEKRLIEYINKLINLQTLEDKYINASLSGIPKPGNELEKELGEDRKGIKSTGSRKKYFFDFIIFTQIANVPDHWTFASHHYLRDLNYKYFTELNSTRKSYYNCEESQVQKKCKGEYFLLPDHALTDGSDKFTLNRNEVRGIEFHPELDMESLYRPDEKFSREVYINRTNNHNRGFIVTKGSINRSPYSAFKNSLGETTCLDEFLRNNKVNSLYVCGIGRENTVKRTLLDSLKYDFIRTRTLIYDASMPILVAPVIKKDEDVRMVGIDNDWTESLKNKGIMVENSNFFLNLGNSLKTKLDKSQISQGVSNIVSIFGDSRQTKRKQYNNYEKLVEPRKKKSKKNKKKKVNNRKN